MTTSAQYAYISAPTTDGEPRDDVRRCGYEPGVAADVMTEHYFGEDQL